MDRTDVYSISPLSSVASSQSYEENQRDHRPPSYVPPAPETTNAVALPSYTPRQAEPQTQIQPQPQPTPSNPHSTRKATLQPPNQHRKIRFATLTATLFSMLLTTLFTLLIFISGTTIAPGAHKPSQTTLLLAPYSILTIPIKYPFLCHTYTSQAACEPRWHVKMYLNAVWAVEDVSGNFVPVHLLWRGMGRTFNLTTALMVMDERLRLRGEGFIGGEYEVPTEPAKFVLGMTPVRTPTPFGLLVAALMVYVLVLALWVGRHAAAKLSWGTRPRRVLQRKVLGVLMLVPFGCSLAAAAYINEGASKAAEQVKGNMIYISSPLHKPSFGTKFEGLVAGVVVMELLAFVCFGMHAWVDRRVERKVEEYERRVEQDYDGGAETDMRREGVIVGEGVDDPPRYTFELSDLDRIRLTEIEARRRLQGRQNN